MIPAGQSDESSQREGEAFAFRPGERESLESRLTRHKGRFGRMVVAIDGPGGSGKSTTARRVAGRLGFLFLDTGAMYRALTLVALRSGADLANGDALAALSRAADLRLELSEEGARVFVGSEDVSDAIRFPEVTASVSQVSAHADVRADMVRRQREVASYGGVVIDGRDIGTVVFPDAAVKVFLTADPRTRALRRRLEEEKRGVHRTLEEIGADLVRRDREDSTRSVSPLVRAADAVLLDTSGMSLEEQVDAVLALVLRQAPGPGAGDAGANGAFDVDPAEVAQPGYRPFHSGLHWLVHFLIGLVSRPFFGMRIVVHPAARLPGSVLVACNHISGFDPFLAGSSLPFECWYIAKLELFRSAWMGKLMGRLNAIPIRRRTADYAALDRAVDLLRQGRNVFMFLEGTRQVPGRLGTARWGFGYVAARAGRPIVPVFVRGSRDQRPRGLRRQPLEIWVGEPLDVRHMQGSDDPDTHLQIGAAVMTRIAALMLRSAAQHPLPGLELPGIYGPSEDASTSTSV
jgi:cytidylate kinase